MSKNRHLAILSLLGYASLSMLPGKTAQAASGDEFLALLGEVDVNVIFYLDLSSSMGEPCVLESTDAGLDDEAESGLPEMLDSTPDTGGGGPGGGPDTSARAERPPPPAGAGDTGGPFDTGGGGGEGGTGGGSGDSASSGPSAPCLVMAIDAINQVAMRYDGVRYAVIGTVEDADDTNFYPIVPLGSTASEVVNAMEGLNAWETDTRNLAEGLAELADTYLTNTDPDDDEDDDGDGNRADWTEAPIEWSCQETHVIVITRDRPAHDEDVSSLYRDTISPDYKCTAFGETSSTDTECKYDNTVSALYTSDLRSDLSNDQNVIVHTIALGAPAGSVTDDLYSNASDVIDGAGLYTAVDDADEILSAVMTVLRDIRSGTYSHSPPIISQDGSYLIYAFYEIDGDNPLAEGHIRAYEMETDPTDPDYGTVLYDGPDEFGGAVWDGGDLLVSRPVTAGESNPDDRDGFGKRDIYTFFEPAYSALSDEADSDHRMGFDYEFVYALSTDTSALHQIMNLDTTKNPPCGDDKSFDLNDDCLIDDTDMQAMVDFARGLPEATYRFYDLERGTWKLGDSPHSVPVVVSKRNNAYTVDPTYRTFLKEMEESDYPDIVLIAANDGMLHAFQLEDDTSTLDTEEGEELWAWIPGQLLYRDQDTEWAGRLIDLMLYGRTFLFDGTPVVEDVWIDADDDNAKDCTSLDDCEWRRVVVVQQGKGGVVTLALDISNPTSPQFLWEQTDETDSTAMGYTVSTPVIANIYDKSGSDEDKWHDRWVAMWGSGRAVPWGMGHSNYESAEANLYMWHIGDDYWGTSSVGYTDHGDNGHPESDVYDDTLDTDDDGEYEYGYISGALAVVDVDSDGDADTVYFPVTTSYDPTDEGGDGPVDTKDPGSTWMYKACIPGKNPDNLRWIEFYDPIDDSGGAVTSRPEVYYAATTSWFSDGSLGVYWGTGSPYNRDYSTNGLFFAVKDSDPGSCTSDTMTPISDCGTNGVTELDPGEGLTSYPTVYQGVVYFSTWAPEEDICNGGEGRVYALNYEDCDAAIDLDANDEVTDADRYTTIDGYPSGVTVTDMGTVLVGTATPDVDDDGTIGIVSTDSSMLYVSQTLAWLEIF